MTTFDKENSYLLAKKEVKKIKGFYIHLFVYLVINTIFIVNNTIANGWEGFKTTLFSIVLFWGIGLFFHWYGTFGKNILFGKKWEKKKIQDLLDKDKFL